MKIACTALSDEEFLRQFEDLKLDPSQFGHLGHLRLTWLYLADNDVDTAVDLVCFGIRKYAANLGAKRKFHLTMTDDFVRIMAQRIHRMPHRDWALFLVEKEGLVVSPADVLRRYFSDKIIFSDEARLSLVEQDIQPFEERNCHVHHRAAG